MKENKKVFGLDFIIEQTKQSKKELSWKCDLKATSNFNKWSEQGHIPKKHLEILEEVFEIDRYYINRFLTQNEQLLVKQMLRERKMEVEYLEVEEKLYDSETKEYKETMAMTTTSGTDAEKALLATSNTIHEMVERLLPSDSTESTNQEDYIRSLQFASQIESVLKTIMNLQMQSMVNIIILPIIAEAIESGLIGTQLKLDDFGNEEDELKISIRDTIIKYKESRK